MSTGPAKNLEQALQGYTAEALLAFVLWCCDMQTSPNVVSLETWKRTTRFPT